MHDGAPVAEDAVAAVRTMDPEGADMDTRSGARVATAVPGAGAAGWQYFTQLVKGPTVHGGTDFKTSLGYLTQLGWEGWELVNVVPLAGAGGATELLLYTFKRPR